MNTDTDEVEGMGSDAFRTEGSRRTIRIISARKALFAPRLGPQAIRYSLALFGFVNLWSAAHYLLAARTLRADLASRDNEDARPAIEYGLGPVALHSGAVAPVAGE